MDTEKSIPNWKQLDALNIIATKDIKSVGKSIVKTLSDNGKNLPVEQLKGINNSMNIVITNCNELTKIHNDKSGDIKSDEIGRASCRERVCMFV